MSFADRYLEFLGSTTITAAATAFTVTIAPRALLFIEIFIPSWSATFLAAAMQVNGDTGTNYSYSNPIVTAGGTTWGNNNGGPVAHVEFGQNEGTAAAGMNAVLYAINTTTQAKIFTGFSGMRNGNTTTSSEPDMIGFMWNNTTAPITSITINTLADGLGGTTTMAAGSGITVFGCDY